MSINILVVDDSVTIRTMIAKALRMSLPDLGEIYEADNGISALARLVEKDIDAVLTDINMPRMDGIQLIGKIKSMPNLSGIPIVVISTDGSSERLKNLEGQGICGYLHKPFRPEQLKQILSHVLELKYDHQTSGSDQCDF
jgi:two-component system chemotaxis response regulator CheY